MRYLGDKKKQRGASSDTTYDRAIKELRDVHGVSKQKPQKSKKKTYHIEK